MFVHQDSFKEEKKSKKCISRLLQDLNANLFQNAQTAIFTSTLLRTKSTSPVDKPDKMDSFKQV